MLIEKTLAGKSKNDFLLFDTWIVANKHDSVFLSFLRVLLRTCFTFLIFSFFFFFSLVCARFISWHLAVLANLYLFLFPLFPLITLSLRSSFYLYFELSTRSYLLVTGLSTLCPLSLSLSLAPSNILPPFPWNIFSSLNSLRFWSR